MVSVHLPPLRSRREDITLLTDYFLKQFTASHGKVVTSIAPAARKALMTHPWPGNVRELKNTIESMVVIDSDGVLDIDDLTEDLAPAAPAPSSRGAGLGQLVGRPLEEIEKYYIAETLKLTAGNREEAAEAPRDRRADLVSQDQGIRDRLSGSSPSVAAPAGGPMLAWLRRVKIRRINLFGVELEIDHPPLGVVTPEPEPRAAGPIAGDRPQDGPRLAVKPKLAHRGGLTRLKRGAIVHHPFCKFARS